jgi:hypothetical protein
MSFDDYKRRDINDCVKPSGGTAASSIAISGADGGDAIHTVGNGHNDAVTGTITGNAQSVTITSMDGYNGFNIIIYGTFSLSMSIQQSPDGGTTWMPVVATRTDAVAAPAAVTGAAQTAAASWACSVPAATQVRVLSTAYTSGTMNVRIEPFTNILANQTIASITGTAAVTAGGAAAHDAAISGNPVRIAGRALTTAYTSVTTGDTADIVTTIRGYQITKENCIPEDHLSAVITVTNNADNAVFAAAAAGLKNCLTSLTLQNTNATAPGVVSIRDGTTVRWSVNLPASMTTPLHFVFPTPPVTTAATALNIIAATTAANILVSATGYRAP